MTQKTQKTLDEYLKDMLQEADDLCVATNFILNKDEVHSSLLEVSKTLSTIKLGLIEQKKDLEKLKSQSEECKELQARFTAFSEKIKQINRLIPDEPEDDHESEPENIPNMPKSAQSTRKNTSVINGMTPATFKFSKSCKKEIKPDADDILDTSEFYSHGNNCRKNLFKEEYQKSYVIDLITDNEFKKIPKYMVGRLTCTHLNEFISTINQILKAKYGLLALGKIGARKKGHLDLYLQLRKEQSDIYPDKDVDKFFFTAEDYLRETKLKLDKAKFNMLTILRHCKRIHELRSGKAVRYEVIVAN